MPRIINELWNPIPAAVRKSLDTHTPPTGRLAVGENKKAVSNSSMT